MPAELTQKPAGPLPRMTRAHQAQGGVSAPALPALFTPVLALLALGFLLVGAGNLDLGPADARIGLAAREGIGPLGQVCGNWVPDVWPGRVLPSMISRVFQDRGSAAPESVLWPTALAALATGWRLANRLAREAGTRCGLWFGLCWFGCLGVIDHSGTSGLDFLSGLAIVAAIDQLLSRGSDWTAGLWTAVAFCMGGWPPVALVFLAVIVIGRHEAQFSIRLLLPPIVAAVAWSFWTVAAGSSELWAAAITLPLMQKPDWLLALKLVGLGLPFSLVALLTISPAARESWLPAGRQMVTGWFQSALAMAIAGTIIPGLSAHARVPALAGLLIVSAMGLEAAWSRTMSTRTRRIALGVSFGLMLVWLMTLLYGGYLWLLVFSYYRTIGIIALLLGLPFVMLTWQAMERADSRRALLAMILLAVSLKIVHWGYYVPEWNYRHGQGPWGRAIGQWLLPDWTVHTFLDWPDDLMFAIGRPVRRLATPRHLNYELSSGRAAHVLLLESEFEHWPEEAPPLTRVASLLDSSGERRILARTPGLLFAPSGILETAEPSP